MIAHVYGTVVEKIVSSLIIDVNGVGYEVQVAAGDYEATQLDSAVKLYTYHHIREQSQDLYGFYSMMAKRLFELLITVQGVGPKAALAILSMGDVEQVRSAIALGDVKFVTGASGVGKKTAERVIVDLSDKVGQATRFINNQGANIGMPTATDEATEALMALGFSLNDATASLDGVPADLSTAERVRLALKRKA
ncbi:Holliday junction branch migration protein RuvA [Candidatus Saccharibacteria bacterium]|nr:Holliday junction branch migration protein RuvA [Candidatus Saccharibacteria bacterium]